MARSRPDIVPVGIAVVAGVLSWDLVRLFGDRREAWDDPKYWLIGYPLMLAAAFMLGLGFPDRPWRWAVAIVTAQAVWAIFLALAADEAVSLLPLGMLTFALLALPCVLSAYIGQWLRYRWPQ